MSSPLRLPAACTSAAGRMIRRPGLRIGATSSLVGFLGAAGAPVVAEGPPGVHPLLWWAGTMLAPIAAGLLYEALAHARRRRAARLRARAAELLADGDPKNDGEASELEAEAEEDERSARRLEARGREGDEQ